MGDAGGVAGRCARGGVGLGGGGGCCGMVLRGGVAGVAGVARGAGDAGGGAADTMVALPNVRAAIARNVGFIEPS